MHKGRLEAFSDGVIAILITIMVLELKVPRGTDWDAVTPVLPIMLTYLLSFVFLGIYRNNHHHLFHAADRINGLILWANLHLLFWLSLIPFTMRWMAETSSASLPTAVYGVVLFMAGLAFRLIVSAIIAEHGPHSKLATAVGKDVKGWTSLALYALAIPLAFVHQGIALGLYVAVALIWLVPDRRIERNLTR